MNLRSAALLSLTLVLPFAILESIHTTLTRENAPGIALLFVLLWLLPTAFLTVSASMVRNRYAHPLQVVVVVALVLLWGGLLVDQMPCFLGVPNCD